MGDWIDSLFGDDTDEDIDEDKSSLAGFLEGRPQREIIETAGETAEGVVTTAHEETRSTLDTFFEGVTSPFAELSESTSAWAGGVEGAAESGAKGVAYLAIGAFAITALLVAAAYLILKR